VSKVKKEFLVAILFFLPLLLCSFFFYTKPTHWSYQETFSNGVKSAIVQYEPRNKVDGVGVEFLKVGNTLQTSLSLFYKSYDPRYHGRNVPVTLKCEEVKKEGHALCLNGGQKLTLSQEMQQVLINELNLDQPVTIHLGENQSTLFPSNFKKYMKKLNS
jgi:hypothetical protein